MDSTRRVRLFSGARLQVREIAALRLRIPPLRNVFSPRLPRESFGPIKRNADRGRRAVEVSGWPIVRPSTEGSTRLGRSPGEPSTFPKPGPSEPEKTVKGDPVFARKMVDTFQRPMMFRTAAGALSSLG